MARFFLILYVLFFFAQGVHYSSALPYCKCPGYNSIPTLQANATFQATAEIINGTNYGVPIVVGNVTVLPGNFNVTPSLTELNAVCPLGYRPPTQQELTVIFRTKDFIFLKNVLGIMPDKSYVSTTKSLPGSIIPTVFESWNFRGFSLLSENGQIQENDVNTFFENPTFTRCIFDINQKVPLRIAQRDFIQGVDYEVGLINKNFPSYGFRFKNQTVSQDTFFVNFTDIGCNTLEFFALTMSGQTLYNCRKIFVNPYLGSETGTTLSGDSIKSLSIATNVQRMIYLFWNRGNAPVAPIAQTGGFYVAFTGNDNNTYVQEFDANLTKIKETNIGVNAFVMDIVANDPGFTLYVKDVQDNNNAYLIGFYQNYTQKYRVQIMNNGVTPSQITQQLSFWDKNGNILSGLETMFSASSGKLAYGRGRIGLLFSHYNAFGTAAARNDHQGDTFYTFDRKGGNETIAWSWKTSHSLYQTSIYDGQYFITASLGDMFPTNIKICIVEFQKRTDELDLKRNKTVTNPSYCSDVVPGTIPGNGNGAVCGRIGGLVQQGNTYGLIYARKPCQLTTITNQQSASSDDEIALLTFNINSNMNITNINKIPLGLATQLTGIRAAKWGSNIFITYTWMASENFGLNPPTQYIIGDKALETQYAMLVDFSGNFITRPYVVNDQISVSPSDDIRVLNDGKVVWTYVDKNGQLFVFYLPSPNPLKLVDTNPVREDTLPLEPKIINISTNINSQVLFLQLKSQLWKHKNLRKRLFLSKRHK